MCPIGNDLVRIKGKMDFELFKKGIDDITQWGISPNIGLNGMGEPLSNRGFAKYIKYASSKGFHTFFSTNAYLFSEKKIKQLAYSGLRELKISFEAEDPQEYEKIRRGSSYKKVLKQIQNFLAYLQKNHIKMVVDILVIKYTREKSLEIDSEFKRLFTHLYPVNFYSFYASDWRGTVEKEYLKNLQVTHSAIYEVCNKFKELYVGVDGSVRYCTLDYNGEHSVYNLNDMTLQDIWHSQSREKIMSLMKQGKWDQIDMCSSCSAPYTIKKRERLLENEKCSEKLDLPVNYERRYNEE
jgi:radical SAM protein with 4Fe4S-binding SPASM domain